MAEASGELTPVPVHVTCGRLGHYGTHPSRRAGSSTSRLAASEVPTSDPTLRAFRGTGQHAHAHFGSSHYNEAPSWPNINYNYGFRKPFIRGLDSRAWGGVGLYPDGDEMRSYLYGELKSYDDLMDSVPVSTNEGNYQYTDHGMTLSCDYPYCYAPPGALLVDRDMPSLPGGSWVAAGGMRYLYGLSLSGFVYFFLIKIIILNLI